MKKYFFSAIAMALAAIMSVAADNYKVTVAVPAEMDGQTAVLVDYDNGAVVDSVKISGGTAAFAGTVDEPLVARIIVSGKRLGSFILEEGQIEVDAAQGTVKGGRLNDVQNEFEAQVKQLSDMLGAVQSEQEQAAIYARYAELTDSVMRANMTNPIGYLVFMDKAYDFEPTELEKFVDDNPYFKKFDRVNKLLESNRRKIATSEGRKFADFEIEYDGVKHRLSDVVGKGDYVLVDFWASWCGPCIRQTAVIKDIYNKYKDDGLKVLGVAVWDEPENTVKAIEQHQLPWESWLNGGNIPTDIYGIAGIPCIILFGPDGTILSRDKQSDQLRAAVDKAMAEKAAAAQ